MKTRLLTIMLSLINIFTLSYSQEIDVKFTTNNDTITSSNKTEITHEFSVELLKSKSIDSVIVTVNLIETEFSIPKSDIFLVSDLTIKGDTTKNTTKKFKIKFLRNFKDDRLIKFNLIARKNGKEVKIKDNREYTLYVKPAVKDSLKSALNKGYEFWVFTGTNLDLLDGVKARELFLKGNYLFNLKKDEKESQSWINIGFGKNRYFSEKDTIQTKSFVEEIPTTSLDSTTLVYGKFNSLRTTETNSIFLDLDYMFQVKQISSITSKIFLKAGFSISLQDIRNTYKNNVIVSDTITVAVGNRDSEVPMFRTIKYKQFNLSFNVGFAHIFDNDEVNIKSFLSIGLNRLNYPYGSVERNNGEIFQSKLKPYLQFKMDATVLKPGLSIGLENFLRIGEVPLFNVTLTKVIDLSQLNSLFAKLKTNN